MTITIVDWLYIQRPGVGPNWYIFRVFGVERLWTTIWLPLAWDGWPTQHPDVASAYFPFIIRVHQYSGSKWMLQRHPAYCHTKRAAFYFLPGSFTLRTCVSYSKKSFFAPEVYVSTVDILYSYRSFMSETQHWCSESVWTVLIICCIFMEMWCFHYTGVK
jgi:hypothetical protein